MVVGGIGHCPQAKKPCKHPLQSSLCLNEQGKWKKGGIPLKITMDKLFQQCHYCGSIDSTLDDPYWQSKS